MGAEMGGRSRQPPPQHRALPQGEPRRPPAPTGAKVPPGTALRPAGSARLSPAQSPHRAASSPAAAQHGFHRRRRHRSAALQPPRLSREGGRGFPEGRGLLCTAGRGAGGPRGGSPPSPRTQLPAFPRHGAAPCAPPPRLPLPPVPAGAPGKHAAGGGQPHREASRALRGRHSRRDRRHPPRRWPGNAERGGGGGGRWMLGFLAEPNTAARGLLQHRRAAPSFDHHDTAIKYLMR